MVAFQMQQINSLSMENKLLVTCCYFEVLKRWQPILLSWIAQETRKTYEYHFFKLFESIGDQLKVCNSERSSLLLIFQQIIASVVDYSNTQRLGFQDTYV